jgi:hypothetical protein
MGRKFLKIFFSRSRWPNSIKLDKNYPWVKGIPSSFKERASSSSKGR